MLQTKPADLISETRFVSLVSKSGEYLHLSGTMLTAEPKQRYRGTLDQANRMRDRLDPAWGLRIIPFQNQRG